MGGRKGVGLSRAKNKSAGLLEGAQEMWIALDTDEFIEKTCWE